jgi:tetratricopeptide (TPR) repeat protein
MTRVKREPEPDTLGELLASPDRQAAVPMLLLDSARDADPLLAHLLRVSAVPRSFDEPLLAVLADRDPDDPGFQSSARRLLTMSFIVRRHDGLYRLHDAIRGVVLTTYDASASDRKQLRALRERLIAYYRAEHDRARDVARQFDVVAGLLRRVSPERLVRLRSVVEDLVVRPLIEAMHHLTLVDPTGEALTQFGRWFDLYEHEGRLEICRLLLRAWSDDLQRLTDRATKELLDWCSYYQGRLALAEGDGENARSKAEGLFVKRELAPAIRDRAEELLTDSLIAECRLAEALTHTDEQIRTTRGFEGDSARRERLYGQQAKIYGLLHDGKCQAASLVSAIEAARWAGSRGNEAALISRLSVLQASNGDLEGAASCIVQALHIVRTLPSPDAAIMCSAFAIHAIRAFGGREPRLADLFQVEARQVAREDDIRSAIERESAYVIALARNGRFEQAHNVLEQLDARLSDQGGPKKPAVLMLHANLLDAEGREREAVQWNREIVKDTERQGRDAWARAAALTNAATTEMNIGDLLDEAQTSAVSARELWREMGHLRGVALTNVVLAEVSRRRGDYERARELLGEADPLPALGLENRWYWTWAELAADCGRQDEAAQHLRHLLDSSARRGDLRNAASVAARLVECLFWAGDQDSALKAGDELGGVLARIRKIRSYRSTPSQNDADEHNGRGVRLLCADSRRPMEEARSAVQHFDEAMAGDPEPFWYPLNQAYAFAKLRNRKGVKAAMAAAGERAAGSPFEEPVGRLAEVLLKSLKAST